MSVSLRFPDMGLRPLVVSANVEASEIIYWQDSAEKSLCYGGNGRPQINRRNLGRCG